MSNRFRYAFAALSAIQALMSYLFAELGGLFFFLEETSEIYPVREMVSAGSEDDFGITVGFFLFSFLTVFHLFRLKRRVNRLDNTTILIVLSVQAVYLAMIETGSFALSIKSEYGWILASWLTTYGIFWISLLLSIYAQHGRQTQA